MALLAVTVSAARVMVRVPGVKVMVYFGELRPEQVIGYEPTGLFCFAVVVQTSVPESEAGVSPLAKPE